MNKKKIQSVMLWILPVIVIGGLFYPLLGYLVLLSMVTLITLSFFRGRYWCVYLCPRGSFLDIILRRVSFQRPVPRLFSRPKFKWIIFAGFMGFFLFRMISVEKTAHKIGFVFVQMCLLTTIIAVIPGILTKERSWCVFCPMGTLQAKIASLAAKLRKRSA